MSKEPGALQKQLGEWAKYIDATYLLVPTVIVGGIAILYHIHKVYQASIRCTATTLTTRRGCIEVGPEFMKDHRAATNPRPAS